MNRHEPELLAVRFAAMASEPLAGDWDDVLGRVGVAGQPARRRRRSRALAGSRRRRFAVLAAAALVVIESFPVWSPDWRKIAFARESGDRCRLPDGKVLRYSDVYVMSADGKGLKRLTRNRASAEPAWSPDGRSIAFVRSFGRGPGVYLMNPDGSGKRNLTREWGLDGLPVWSWETRLPTPLGLAA